ncbi:MAG TPA: glycine cleavage system protein GcvH [Deinococcales bacterium]|nr:glycine cleavage system protein GcvH [Deinococcales bacterium]
MNIPDTLRYTKTHEWLRQEADGTVTVGITDFAQEQLGDIVYVELPAIGKALEPGKAAAVVESVKTASDIYTPVAGEVIAVNEALADQPERLNEAPYEAGWLFRLRPSGAPAGLLDAAGYAAQVESEQEH